MGSEIQDPEKGTGSGSATLTNIAEQPVCSCGFRLVQYSLLLLLLVYQ